MSDLYGFCTVEQADVPIVADRRCPRDGSLVLPPSWSVHTATWTGTGWLPERPRPEGYAYVPPAFLSQPVVRTAANPDAGARHRRPDSGTRRHRSAFSSGAPRTPRTRRAPGHRTTLGERGQSCGVCGRSDVQAQRDRLCRPCYKRQRWREQHGGGARPRACLRCGASFMPETGGRNTTAGFCSDECRRERTNQRHREMRARRQKEAAA